MVNVDINDGKDVEVSFDDAPFVEIHAVEEVDKSQLAQWMLEWEKKKRELDKLEEAIKNDVLLLGKTQLVGNVRARYSKGRRDLDWAAGAAGVELTQEQLAEFTEEIPEKVIPAHTVVDYKGICEKYDREPVVISNGVPSVKVILEE